MQFDGTNSSLQKPVLGVDVGTSRIVVARQSGAETTLSNELNAFIEVPDLAATEASLKRQRIPFARSRGSIIIYGQSTVVFAELFHSDLKRPMTDGCVDLRSQQAPKVLQRILWRSVGEASDHSSVLCYSIPSHAADPEAPPFHGSLTSHQTTLQNLFSDMGYDAQPVSEGKALLYGDLQDGELSGLALSFGSGLCNVALQYLSVPIADFSISKGGDQIDRDTAAALGEKASRIRLFKERQFSLMAENKDRVSSALQIMHLELIRDIVSSLAAVFVESNDVPKLDDPIPVILGGGTVMPSGFLEAFQSAFMKVPWPFSVSEVRLASDPLHAVARGALRYAQLNYSNRTPVDDL